MSNASILRKINRKSVVLPTATRLAREAGSIAQDTTISVIIRKVKVGEVISVVPTPPSVFRLAALQNQGDGEDPELARARLEQAMRDDPDLLMDSQRQTMETQRAVIALGVVSDRVTLKVPENDDDLTPEDFGDDFAHLYDAIVDWSSLPYARLGGAAGVTAFPAEPVGDQPQPHGEVLRDDPVPPAGP